MVAKEDEIGALWERQAGNGTRYLSGKIKSVDGSEQDVVIFWNSHKQEGERTPDWRVYKSKPRDGAPPQQQPSRQPPQHRAPPRASERKLDAAMRAQAPSRSVEEELDDEIPF